MLYSFPGGSGGGYPFAGLIFDSAGNLYGTTRYDGSSGWGVVFELTPRANDQWVETVLYSFTGGADGSTPYAGLIFDGAGNIYGTTSAGGNLTCTYLPDSCGVVFELTPSASGPWIETILYSFTGGSDGANPNAGLIFDSGGNLYGTTLYGGNQNNDGVVFALTPSASGQWTETVLQAFTGGNDGARPYDGLILDSANNLYGTAFAGGSASSGVVFELTPPAKNK